MIAFYLIVVICGYALLFVLALVLSVAIAKRKDRAALIVTVVFVTPIGLLAALFGLDSHRSKVTQYEHARETARFQEICEKQGLEVIHRREDGVAGLALEMNANLLPASFGRLAKPEYLLARGYSFIELDGDRYLQADYYGELRVVGAPREGRFLVRLTGEKSKTQDLVDATAYLRIESLDGHLLAEKRWIHNDRYGTCPSLGAPTSGQVTAALDFIATALAPSEPIDGHGAPPKMNEGRATIKELDSPLERVAASKVSAHWKKALDCGTVVELPDNTASTATSTLPQIYFNLPDQRRVVSSRSLQVDQVFCAGKEVYGIAKFSGSLVLAHYDRTGRLKGLQRMWLSQMRGVDFRREGIPIVFDLSVTKEMATFQRVHVSPPIPTALPSYPVMDAYAVEVTLPADF